MTTADAVAFWSHHDGGVPWCDHYRESALEASRDAVLEALPVFGVPERVLEIGCHCGPLLRRLGKHPGVKHAFGLDANETAVRAAQADGLLAALGVVPEALGWFPARIFDVVVSSYCLAYISPEDITYVVSECLRVSKHGVLFAEPSAGPGVPTCSIETGNYAEWRHEYLDVLEAARHLLVPQPALAMRRTRLRTETGVNAIITARIQWPN